MLRKERFCGPDGHLVQLRDPALVHGGGVRQDRAHHVTLGKLIIFRHLDAAPAVHQQASELDELINEFNEATGLLKNL